MQIFFSFHRKIHQKMLRRLNLATVFFIGFFIISVSAILSLAYAASVTKLTMSINAGTLSANIVDASYTSILIPTVHLSDVLYEKKCRFSTGIFGTSKQQIYISNPDAAHSGWSVTLAPVSPDATWVSGNYKMDFNDPSGSGCEDGPDRDNVAGSMTINPRVSSFTIGQCAHCATHDIALGSVATFSEGVTDNITIITGSPGSDTIGDWILKGIEVTQTIPPLQEANGEYTLPFYLSVTAQ